MTFQLVAVSTGHSCLSDLRKLHLTATQMKTQCYQLLFLLGNVVHRRLNSAGRYLVCSFSSRA